MTREAVSASSDVFVGRQPIFDRGERVVGYEILFRDGQTNSAQVTDGSKATAMVMLSALTEIGLDRLVGPCRAWINLTRESALDGLALTLPAHLTCFEILEGQEVDDELIGAVADLRDLGYQIALDDFSFTPGTEALLPLAHFVKLDYAALGPDRFAAEVMRLERYEAHVLAEKVETHWEHTHCVRLGCDLFQGFFYQRPEILSERRIELNQGSTFQLIAALQDPTLDLDDLEPLIARDVPLSLRLLRYLNSAFLGLAHKVASVREALVLLGIENTRRWATLTAMCSLEGKTSELTVAALLRGRFCELAGVQLGLDGSQLFTVGMFSLLDAMMDAPLEEALDQLPFPSHIRDALLRHEGVMGRILSAALALEAGSAAGVPSIVEEPGNVYTQALLWAQDAATSLLDSATAP